MNEVNAFEPETPLSLAQFRAVAKVIRELRAQGVREDQIRSLVHSILSLMLPESESR